MAIEPIDTDMSATASLAWSLFLGSAMCGWTIYELYRRNKDSETKIQTLEEELHEATAFLKVHQEVLEETDRRIREKKDYDDSEEVEHHKYQAWKGLCIQEDLVLAVCIVREKESSVGKNLQWMSWSEEQDGSCVVRDFYLGNSSPEFHWKIFGPDGGLRAIVEETMINGWDSVVKLEISITVSSEKNLVSTSGDQSLQAAFNSTLKALLPKINWSRVLVDA